MARRNKNPWTSTSEVLLWVLFVLLLVPAVFAGYAVGHYTSLGKPQATVTVTNGMTTTPTPPTTTTSMTTTTSGGGANIADGKSVFASAGCSSCHTLAAASATGQVGPNLDKAIPADAQADGNMSLPAFVKDSIVNPDAYIAKGFTAGIMPKTFGKSLKPTQIDDLVALILSSSSH